MKHPDEGCEGVSSLALQPLLTREYVRTVGGGLDAPEVSIQGSLQRGIAFERTASSHALGAIEIRLLLLCALALAAADPRATIIATR